MHISKIMTTNMASMMTLLPFIDKPPKGALSHCHCIIFFFFFLASPNLDVKKNLASLYSPFTHKGQVLSQTKTASIRQPLPNS